MPDLKDTIAAEATPPGRGSVRIVRVSGEGALAAARTLFRPRGVAPWEADRTLCLGDLAGPTGVLDRCLAVVFKAPDSFTGEDVVEFQVHGSPGVVRGLLDRAMALGARYALPGEFSFRAYLNGKVSVMEAEAVNALVAAETDGQAEGLAGGLAGQGERQIQGLSDRLLTLRAAWEARIDFPEDVGGSALPEEMEDLRVLERSLQALARSGRTARRLREGWRVALVGAVNSGKSSLFNTMLKRERALVTPHPGTTRDVLEESVQIGRYPLVLLDTAGVRSSSDPVEALGVAAGLEAARRADAALLVYDGGEGWSDRDEAVLAALDSPPMAILANKLDLVPHGRAKAGALSVSALTGQGLEALSDALQAWMEAEAPREGEILVSERQVAHADAAARACGRALEDLSQGASEEVALQSLAEAQRALEDLLAGGPAADLYDRIFSTFCIGK